MLPGQGGVVLNNEFTLCLIRTFAHGGEVGLQAEALPHCCYQMAGPLLPKPAELTRLLSCWPEPKTRSPPIVLVPDPGGYARMPLYPGGPTYPNACFCTHQATALKTGHSSLTGASNQHLVFRPLRTCDEVHVGEHSKPSGESMWTAPHRGVLLSCLLIFPCRCAFSCLLQVDNRGQLRTWGGAPPRKRGQKVCGTMAYSGWELRMQCGPPSFLGV